MKEEIMQIYKNAIEDSYYLRKKDAYWCGYFIGKLNESMSVSHEDLDKFYKVVMSASEKLYDQTKQTRIEEIINRNLKKFGVSS